MNRSDKPSFRRRFSHIYIERAAFGYPLTERVLASFPDAVIVPIDNYKQIFSRPRQNFRLQKKSPKIIIAIKQPPFIYEASEECQAFGSPNFFYTTPALGCVYDCTFCYLQGLFDSANLVVFANTEGFESAICEAIESRGHKDAPLSLSVSYDTDLLAVETHTGLCRMYIELAARTKDLEIEIRTRSVNIAALSNVKPNDRVILSWSLAPSPIAKRYERGAPSPKKRIEALAKAADSGWRLRLCFDPVVPIEGWQDHYRELIEDVFTTLPEGAVKDVSTGPFRMGAEQMRRATQNRPDCYFFKFAFDSSETDIDAFMLQELLKFLPKNRIEHFQKTTK